MKVEISEYLILDLQSIEKVEFALIREIFSECTNYWGISGVNTYSFSYKSTAKITMKNGEIHDKDFFAGFAFCVRENHTALDYSLVIVKCEKDILGGSIQLKEDPETAARKFITPEIEGVFLRKIETEIKEFKAKLL